MRAHQEKFDGADAPTRKERVLDSQLSQIEKRIGCLIDTNYRVAQAITRLLNPRPAEAEQKDQGAPTANTVEGRLNGILHMLEVVQSAADENASDLDSAI